MMITRIIDCWQLKKTMMMKIRMMMMSNNKMINQKNRDSRMRLLMTRTTSNKSAIRKILATQYSFLIRINS